jgi:hypothetical protein
MLAGIFERFYLAPRAVLRGRRDDTKMQVDILAPAQDR